MRSIIAVLLAAVASSVFAAAGDVPLAPVRYAPIPDLTRLELASSGSEYLIAYAYRDTIFWQRIALDGTALDGYARRVDQATLEVGNDDGIEIVWTGESYLLFWEDDDGSVKARAIDREGAVTAPFTVVSGMTLRDLARWQNEIAVLTSAGDTWRLTILNQYGALLGVHEITQPPTSFELVRLDSGWALVAPVPGSGAVAIVPQNGSTNRIATDRTFEDVHPSPARGALLVGTDASLGVLRPNGAFVPLALAVDRLSVFHAALIAPSPTGWTVIYRRSGVARIASVRTDGTVVSDTILTGPFPSPHSTSYYSFAAASAGGGSHLLLQPAPVGVAVGLESIAISGDRSYVTAAYAIGEAVQDWARVAHWPGIDLVVWLEAGVQGWDIRATRVQDGTPLDETIVLGSGFPSSLETTFDGEAFAVVWSDQAGIFLRRVDLQGVVIDPEPFRIAEQPAQIVTVAGSGDGGLLVGWQEPRPTVAYLRTRRVRSTAPVGTTETGYQIEAGASRTAYLVALAQPPISCRLSPCELEWRRVAVQLVGQNGIPTGSPLPITEPTIGTVGRPVAHAGDWYVPFFDANGPRLYRVAEFLSSVIGSVPTILAGRPFDRVGGIRSTPAGLAIVGARFRGLLSAEPENLWYEPLPLEAGEAVGASFAESERLLVDTGTRYVLRRIPAQSKSADIAVVLTGRSTSFDTARIEHRGGDDVPALYIEAWYPLVQITASRPIVGGKIEGPFKAGEVIDLVLRGTPPAGSPHRTLVTVLPYARETAAADNFLSYGPPGPEPEPSHRRRLVGRP